MPNTPSITIVKSFTYRGKPEEFSNTYHFSGDTPANAAAWEALGVAIWNAERPMMKSSVKLAQILGYEAGNENSVFYLKSDDKPAIATLGTSASTVQAAGDQAFWVRWKTPDRTTKGKPIYLRKYFHGFGVTNPDSIDSITVTAAGVYAGKMTDGTLPGGFRVCGPQGAVAGVAKVPTFVTTRTLKRRGADPS